MLLRFFALLILLCLGNPFLIHDAFAASPRDFSERTNWWSFKPARRVAVPSPSGVGAQLQNPIDAFIRHRLPEQGLSPSTEAARRTLIRRVTYDLTGLPPSASDVEQFANDASSSGYEQMVDRLLASPRYGERWARHWLDLVHFGETHGYDKDKLRPNAWPYRDYVIRSFNDDKSYSRFILEQLAGDVLFPDDPNGVIALGFIASGPWDYVGHVELPITKTDGLIARYNDRDDMVMTTMSTFLSLTVHCARCHDHKFDPITQKDYYNLQSVFAGIDRADRPYDTDPDFYRRRRSLLLEQKNCKTRQESVKKQIAALSSPKLQEIEAKLLALRTQLGPAVATVEEKSPGNGYHSNIESKPNIEKWLMLDFGQEIALQEVVLVPARPTDFPDTAGFGFPVRFKLELANDADFREPLTIADHLEADFPNPGDNPVRFEIKNPSTRFLRLTAVQLWQRTKDYVFALGELQAFANGTNIARAARVTALDSIETGRWAKAYVNDGYSSRARLADIPLSRAEQQRRAELQMQIAELEAARLQVKDELVPAELKAESASLELRLAELDQALKALPKPSWVYAAANDFSKEGSFSPANGVRPVHLLSRGDVKRPKEPAFPAGLAAVPGPPPDFELPNADDEGARRAALARWLTATNNMLVRRSLVNRVWQYHFGRGLVDTPNDFGHMGGLPSHPELLDWLAFWFLDHGESFKALDKLIVMSATYRQSSESKSEFAKIDADNRFLWRMNATRLDAESVHDSLLFISGRLDLKMGGPSDRQFFFKDDHSPVYDYTRFDVDSPAACRRSIYRHLVRSVPDPFMECLDAADPSQLVARRYSTLTALQALSMLNNPFVLKQCEHLTERVRKESPDLNVQIALASRYVFARQPTPDESERFVTFAKSHGLESLCRVLVNSSEFLFVD